MAQEPGGNVVSLAGQTGTRGREVTIAASYQAVTTGGVRLAPSNTKRCWLIVVNSGSTNFSVGFDSQAGILTLLPGGTFWINADFPWVGEVYLITASGTGYYDVMELSVA